MGMYSYIREEIDKRSYGGLQVSVHMQMLGKRDPFLHHDFLKFFSNLIATFNL